MKWISLSLLLVLFSVNTIAEEDWTLEKNENGIKVYTRATEGTDIKEFKAITTVSASVAVLDKVISDFEGYPDWQENVTTARVLKKISESTHIMHYSMDLPWPADDRDIVLKNTRVKLKNGGLKYTLECMPDYIDPILDYVRIKKAFGFWKFWPTKEGKTKVIYQFMADPGGSLPDFIINMFIVSEPFDSLSYLKSI